MRGCQEKEASAKKEKKGIIKEIIVGLEEEEGMAHVLENLNNIEIKIAPSHLSQRGRHPAFLMNNS